MSGTHHKPLLIGIAGASGSGKTTVADEIATALRSSCRVVILAEDHYYHDLGLQAGFDPFAHNYDTPSSRDFNKLTAHLTAFQAGEAFDSPIYSHAIHACTGDTIRIDPRQIDVLLLEGILALWDENVRKHFDLSVFVDTPLDECLARRLKRDIQERGRDMDEVLWRYRAHVRPGYHEFIAPCRQVADLILQDGERVTPEILAQPLLQWINDHRWTSHVSPKP